MWNLFQAATLTKQSLLFLNSSFFFFKSSWCLSWALSCLVRQLKVLIPAGFAALTQLPTTSPLSEISFPGPCWFPVWGWLLALVPRRRPGLAELPCSQSRYPCLPNRFSTSLPTPAWCCRDKTPWCSPDARATWYKRQNSLQLRVCSHQLLVSGLSQLVSTIWEIIWGFVLDHAGQEKQLSCNIAWNLSSVLGFCHIQGFLDAFYLV